MKTTLLVQASPWLMYAAYPLLAVIVVASPFFLIWLVWWLEKLDRDTLLVVLPSGFIQYKSWGNQQKRRATVVGYAHVKALTCQQKRASIALIVASTDGNLVEVFLTRKYGRRRVGPRSIWRLLGRSSTASTGGASGRLVPTGVA